MENNDTPKDITDHLIDLELAKSDNKSKVKRYLPAIALAASFYFSFILALGLAIGYIGSKLFFKFFV